MTRTENDAAADVERKLASGWPADADREAARRILATYGTEPYEQEVPRVQLAILMLAGGSLLMSIDAP